MLALFTGVAGLRANQRAVDVIANNIANLNTVGFKAGRVSFQEALVQTLGGASTAGKNPMQVGLGVTISSIDTLMSQGNLKPTDLPTDVAIEGDGFFVLSDGNSLLFSRDGVFQLDAQNRLVSAANGMAVCGWLADPTTGQIQNTSTLGVDSALTIPLGAMTVARQTSEVVYQSNLEAGAADGDSVATSFSFFDSLGADHRVNVAFTKTATDNEWAWEATDPSSGAVYGSGTLTFDENGQCTSPTAALSITLADPGGASSPTDLQLDFSAVTQLAGTSTIQAVRQDGLAMGTLQSFTMDDQGIITGVFSNGMSQQLGQIALSVVANPGGLQRLGNSLYGLSPNSGATVITPPGHAGAGRVASGHIEMSNVDLANEFANLILTQRGFQANSRIITTSDEMLQELLTLKR
jgi:flagellar hook protein FlgE